MIAELMTEQQVHATCGDGSLAKLCWSTMTAPSCRRSMLKLTDPETGLTFGYLRYTETQSNRVFVTVECLYGFKVALTDGLKRIVKP